MASNFIMFMPNFKKIRCLLFFLINTKNCLLPKPKHNDTQSEINEKIPEYMSKLWTTTWTPPTETNKNESNLQLSFKIADYETVTFHGFPQCFQTKLRIMPQNKTITIFFQNLSSPSFFNHPTSCSYIV
jgi:hypothetical protein